MITFFNNLAKSWVAKGILLILTLSMIVFWGLGGLTNMSMDRGEAVQVGSTSVSVGEVNNAFEQLRQKYMKMTGGQYLSPQDAMKKGFLEQAVQNQIAEKVRMQIADNLGLMASNEAVQKYVERNPIFHDATGKFDKNLFYAYLMQTGMSETQLAKELQKELSFKHLTLTIQELGYNPKTLATLAYKFKNEQRGVTGLKASYDKVVLDEKPTDDDLKTYYEAYAEELMLPEFRHLTVVRLTPAMMVDRIDIAEADINEAYEAQKSKYIQPEQRDLAQMRFETEDAAKTAMKGLTATNFHQRATEVLGQTDEVTNFGFTPKNQLMEELAEPVFSAAKGAIVGPIQSPMGWHVFLIKEIKAEQSTPMETAKAEIKKSLAMDKAYEQMEDVARQLEDALGEGKTLTDAAKTVSLGTLDIPAVDIAGQTPAGQPIALLNSELMQNVFILQKGEASSLIQHEDGYIIAEVVDIQPVTQKPFETVKGDLTKMWNTEKQKEKLETLVETIMERTTAGNKLEAQGVIANFDVVKENQLTRTNAGKFGEATLQTIFKQKKGLENVAKTTTDSGYEITVVDTITVPDIEKVDFAILSQTVKALTGENMTAELFDAYSKELGIHVNEKSIQKVFSVYQGQE